jgi:hypothetical protein
MMKNNLIGHITTEPIWDTTRICLILPTNEKTIKLLSGGEISDNLLRNLKKNKIHISYTTDYRKIFGFFTCNNAIHGCALMTIII